MSSGISYLDETWNPTIGCSPVSPGCDHCWARAMDERFGDGRFTVTLHPERLDKPLHWRKPRRVGVCFTGDLFHKDVPTAFIDQVFGVMACAGRHIFQCLSKRPKRIVEYFNSNPLDRIVANLLSQDLGTHLIWPLPNVWLGVSVEDQWTADERIPLLLQTPAAVRFVSIEPMLAAVDMRRWLDCLGDLDGFYRSQISKGMFNRDQVSSLKRPKLNSVIVGCESGPKARPMMGNWALNIVDQCRLAKVPLFVKQISILEGNRWRVSHNPDEWPERLRVREFPDV